MHPGAIRSAVHAATRCAFAITTLHPGSNLKNLAYEEGKKRGSLHLSGLIYHQCAQRNDFWLRAATRTSFLTKRDPSATETNTYIRTCATIRTGAKLVRSRQLDFMQALENNRRNVGICARPRRDSVGF